MRGRHTHVDDRATTVFRPLLLVVLAVALGLASGLLGGPPAEAQDEPPTTVSVATKAIEPFVFVESTESDGRGLSGYSIDVWDELATRLGLRTEWIVQDSVGEILESARTGDAEVAIAGISMTADRETFVDFTHPYYDSGLQLAVRPGSSGAWSSFVGLVTSRTVIALGAGLIILTLLVAHLVWLSERHSNPEFPKSYREGIVEAWWWSSVSIVTGGEAVKDIRRPLSRLLAVGWMIVGLFLIAFVTAQAASSLTVRQLQNDISSIDDLKSRSAVTIEGTVAADYLSDRGIPYETVTDIEEALEAVANHHYDAVVYDTPVLAYLLNTPEYQGRLQLAGDMFAPDPYGIALVTGSSLREAINAELLAMSRDGTLEDLNQEWLGVDR